MERMLLTLICAGLLGGCVGIDYEARGDAAFRKKQYVEALAAYRSIEDPRSPDLDAKVERTEAALVDSYLDRAITALENGHHEEALEFARRGKAYSNDKRLREMEVTAKGRLVEQALERGRLHLSRQQFDIAVSQFAKALEHDNSLETEALLIEAKAGAARGLVARARELVAQRRFAEALTEMDRALSLHRISEFQEARADIETAKARWEREQFDQHVQAGHAARDTKEWRLAAEEFARATKYDLDAVVDKQRVYCDQMAKAVAALATNDVKAAATAFKAAVDSGIDASDAQAGMRQLLEHRGTIVMSGVTALEAKLWIKAAVAFSDALAIKDDEHTARLHQYVLAMQGGEEALGSRDYGEAERQFSLAIGAGVPDVGEAAVLMERVAVRTYWVTVESLVVSPVNVGDRPWDKSLNEDVLGALIGLAWGVPAGQLARAAVQLLPEENMPDIVVEILLPDGRRFRTTPFHKNLIVSPELRFTVRGNHYTRDRVGIRVVDKDFPPGLYGEESVEDLIGSTTLTIGDLVSGRKKLEFQKVLELVTSPAPAQNFRTPPGIVKNAAVVPESSWGNTAMTRSTAREGCETFLVRLDRLVGAFGDYPGDLLDGAPELQLRLIQNNEVVFQNKFIQGRADVMWSKEEAPRALIFVHPTDRFSIELLDIDVAEHDVIGSWNVPGGLFKQPRIESRTRLGSFFSLRVEKR